MYAENKELIVKKGYFTFKEFYKEYKPHERQASYFYTFVLKRMVQLIKTIAIRSLLIVVLGLFIMVLSLATVAILESDTIEFNESILQKIVAKHGNNSLFDDPMVELIENVIGYSKLVFLDRHGNYKIMNEEER